MKYNKSEIMKKAWSQYKYAQAFYKGYDKEVHTFGYCLHIAWRRAKEEVALQEVEKNGVDFEQGMEFYAGYKVVTLRRWTKYGKDRIYINGNDGWYDIQKDEFHWKHAQACDMRYIRAIRFNKVSA